LAEPVTLLHCLAEPVTSFHICFVPSEMQAITQLNTSSLPDEQLSLLRPLHQRGARETKKQRLKRLLQLQRAGYEGFEGANELTQERKVKGVTGRKSESESEKSESEDDDEEQRPAKQARVEHVTAAGNGAAAGDTDMKQQQAGSSRDEEESDSEDDQMQQQSEDEQQQQQQAVSAEAAAAAAKAKLKAVRAQAAALKAQARLETTGTTGGAVLCNICYNLYSNNSDSNVQMCMSSGATATARCSSVSRVPPFVRVRCVSFTTQHANTQLLTFLQMPSVSFGYCTEIHTHIGDRQHTCSCCLLPFWLLLHHPS
jgi:hypothetical protein